MNSKESYKDYLRPTWTDVMPGVEYTLEDGTVVILIEHQPSDYISEEPYVKYESSESGTIVNWVDQRWLVQFKGTNHKTHRRIGLFCSKGIHHNQDILDNEEDDSIFNTDADNGIRISDV